MGVAGSLLDFYSGYQVSQSGMTLPGMGVTQAEYDPMSLAWGIGVVALGAAVLATALLGATSYGRRRMRAFGYLMASFGVLMLFVGVSMYTGVTPAAMQAAQLSGIAMLIVGALMMFSGALMVSPYR